MPCVRRVVCSIVGWLESTIWIPMPPLSSIVVPVTDPDASSTNQMPHVPLPEIVDGTDAGGHAAGNEGRRHHRSRHADVFDEQRAEHALLVGPRRQVGEVFEPEDDPVTGLGPVTAGRGHRRSRCAAA